MRFNRWAADGTWERLLSEVRKQADAAGRIDWVVSIDLTIARVHQHGATLKRDTGAPPNRKNPWFEPPDHAIGRSRGGLTTKLHLVCDGRGRSLGMMITGGNINDTAHRRKKPGRPIEQISVATVRNIERVVVVEPSLFTVLPMVRVLGASIDDIAR